MRKLNIEEFISRAIKIHGLKYNYSESEYQGMNSKILIICNTCNNKFEQRAADHLSGCDCSFCTGKNIDTTSFIQKAKSIHNNKYDYSYSVYIHVDEKIEIKCNICNLIFKQTPHDHLDGHGCPKCANCYKRTKEEFILEAINVHGNKYDYELSNYINNSNKIIIVCNKCNLKFEQTPHNHLAGQGCPECGAKRAVAVSVPETEWLNYMRVPNDCRNKFIFIENKRFNVDALINNIVYEFYGDYYHGNPQKFEFNNFNKKVKKTFGELYQKTIERELFIKNSGFEVISIWENDWKKLKKELLNE